MLASKPLDDKSIMPWGMHKGKQMANVPARYLLYLHDNGCSDPYVKRYILENIDSLLSEVKKGTTYQKNINMTITKDLSEIREVYAKADQTGKTTLEKLFSKNVLGNITDRVKNFEDVCREIGTTPEDIENVFPFDTAKYERVKLACQVLNEGWKPDWSDSNQNKYYPWFRFRDGRFVFHHVFYYFTDSNLASRLCYKDEATARYAGTQFEDLYNDFFLLE